MIKNFKTGYKNQNSIDLYIFIFFKYTIQVCDLNQPDLNQSTLLNS